MEQKQQGANSAFSGGRMPLKTIENVVEVYHRDQQPLGNTEFGRQRPTPTIGRAGLTSYGSGRAGRAGAGRFNVSGVQKLQKAPTFGEYQVPVEQPPQLQTKPPTATAAPPMTPPSSEPAQWWDDISVLLQRSPSSSFDSDAVAFRPASAAAAGYSPYRRLGANMEDDTDSVLSMQPGQPLRSVTPGPEAATSSASTDNGIANLLVLALDEMGAHFCQLGDHCKSMADKLHKEMLLLNGGGK